LQLCFRWQQQLQIAAKTDLSDVKREYRWLAVGLEARTTNTVFMKCACDKKEKRRKSVGFFEKFVRKFFFIFPALLFYSVRKERCERCFLVIVFV
jgi:hypothetical protein